MRTIEKSLGVLVAMALFGGCGEAVGTVDGDQTPDGEQKSIADGKADAWNFRNDPKLFRMDLDYNIENLPRSAATKNTPWSANYWPYYKDGINDRWQGQSELSPAEKYDKAFNGWVPAEGFMDLKPLNTSTCEFDAAYYQGIGPAATWTTQNKGIGRLVDGIDGDRDGVDDADECSGAGNNAESQYENIGTWWGICHAWAPAAIMEPEPLGTVVRDGVEFTVSDQKALIIQQWDKASAHMVGGRCNDKEIERDETGRISNSECRDLNPGAWHVLVTNMIGLAGKGMVIERVFDFEVWNQPLFGYDITRQEEISLERAHELLNVREDEGGEGEPVFGVYDGSRTAQGVLNLVNGATFTVLDDEVGLRSDAARGIIEFRNGEDGKAGTRDDREFSNMTQVTDVNRLGESAFGSLVEYAKEKNLVPLEYAYNDEATRFIEVKMSSKWITEQHPTTYRTDTSIDDYTRSDHYHYILELDDAGEIIGGEWVGSSIMGHPDFVWTGTASRGGNPHLDIETIRDIIREGREDVLGPATPTSEDHNYISAERVEIPDNDVDGVSSSIKISDEGTITSASISLNIEHTYRGDVIVELKHGGISAEVYNGRTAEQGWEDDIVLENQALEVFNGTELSGDWELVVQDTYAQDTGALESFKLSFTVEN